MKPIERLIPYSTQWVEEEDIISVDRVLHSDWITQGPKVNEFEERVASYCGAKYGVAVSNGTAALHIACLAVGIKPGDEVITSPITFAASANCVLYCQGKPVFADILEDTVNIDPDEITKKLTGKTKAIIPVHFAGLPCELEEIKKIAKANNLILIEDAAHALGAEYKGKRIGSIGDLTTLSFHPVKSITTGEGGMILTNNRKLYEKMLSLRHHGIVKKKRISKAKGEWFYEMQHLGYNYRLTDFQCALGISQMSKLERFIRRRNEIAHIYNGLFKGISDFIELPSTGLKFVRHAWHLYIIRIKPERLKITRRGLFNLLRDKNIGAQVHYIPVHLHPYYRRNLGYKTGDYPKAERFYERAISLPIFPKMKDQDVYRVAGILKEAIIRYKK